MLHKKIILLLYIVLLEKDKFLRNFRFLYLRYKNIDRME